MITTAGPAADRGTVLVVDDEAIVRMLVTETLEELGYTAIEAGDGLQGLRILQSDASIDLLVTDVKLPGMNGRQLAEAARVVRPDLPVLFITGYAQSVGGAQSVNLQPGMDLIGKPFSIDDLAAKIRQLVDGPQPG